MNTDLNNTPDSAGSPPVPCSSYVVQHRDPDGKWRDFTVHESREEAKACVANKLHPWKFAIIHRTEEIIQTND
jgi:hypothetical protein